MWQCLGVLGARVQLPRTLMALALTSIVALPFAVADDEPAIPPGQEELLLGMLGKGATLPGGCQLAAGNVEFTVVEASYNCDVGQVVMELSHPSQAIPPAIETESFAISVLEGSPPDGLSDALASRVRAEEEQFEWIWPADEPAEDDGD